MIKCGNKLCVRYRDYLTHNCSSWHGTLQLTMNCGFIQETQTERPMRMNRESREDAVRLIGEQLRNQGAAQPLKGGDTHHYGMIELRILMDFIYGGPPQKEEEEINHHSVHQYDPGAFGIGKKLIKRGGIN